jgi:hypothetical protein
MRIERGKGHVSGPKWGLIKENVREVKDMSLVTMDSIKENGREVKDL